MHNRIQALVLILVRHNLGGGGAEGIPGLVRTMASHVPWASAVETTTLTKPGSPLLLRDFSATSATGTKIHPFRFTGSRSRGDVRHRRMDAWLILWVARLVRGRIASSALIMLEGQDFRVELLAQGHELVEGKTVGTSQELTTKLD